ncbi:MAG: lipid A deacylase LpxR family protein [Planctomycetota bacterium]
MNGNAEGTAHATAPGTARWLLLSLLLLPLLLLMPACAVIITNDQDSFGGNGDRYFTSGLRGQLTVPTPAEPGHWFDESVGAVADLLGGFDELYPNADPALTTVDFVGGQELYTPANLKVIAPLKNDQPYAGWLYVGVARYDSHFDLDETRRDDTETAVELDVGLVGPHALGEWAQKFAHRIAGLTDPKGWDNQLGSELAFVLYVDRRWRHAFGQLSDSGLQADAILNAGGALGTLRTHVLLGETLRLGWNLPRSLNLQSGDRRHALGLDEPAPRSFHFFVGAEGRAVARNLFLDGNTFRDSQDVPRKPFVRELHMGFEYVAGDFRLGYQRTLRSKEFSGQAEGQRFGAFTLAWSPRSAAARARLAR